MGGTLVKILLADRSHLVLDALRDLFLQLGNGNRVVTADSLADAISQAEKERPQLVLVDAWIDRGGAERAVREILRGSPGSALYVMASNFDPDLRRRLGKAGARDCLEKMNLHATAPALLEQLTVAR
jgi:DNA-binding NarL/FixJ family response regulator